MAVVSESDGNVLDCTREWMEKVNRGGLFPLNNITFQSFIAIEKVTKNFLQHLIKNKGHDQHIKEVIESIATSHDVQWHWTLIHQSLESAEDSDWLLREIVKL